MGRVGIFSGTFDPVHKGHVAFALEAKKSAKLNKVIFLPEPKPRHKSGVTHISHREAMLQVACKLHDGLEVLALPDRNFSYAKTMPRLKAKFPNDELYMLFGSDVVVSIIHWPLYRKLLESSGLIIGVREGQSPSFVRATAERLPTPKYGLHVIKSKNHDASSANIRESLGKAELPTGRLKSLDSYIKKHWLYQVIPK
jgi:nicotinate-nucleotide adenylyltransferase